MNMFYIYIYIYIYIYSGPCLERSLQWAATWLERPLLAGPSCYLFHVIVPLMTGHLSWEATVWPPLGVASQDRDYCISSLWARSYHHLCVGSWPCPGIWPLWGTADIVTFLQAVQDKKVGHIADVFIGNRIKLIKLPASVHLFYERALSS